MVVSEYQRYAVVVKISPCALGSSTRRLARERRSSLTAVSSSLFAEIQELSDKLHESPDADAMEAAVKNHESGVDAEGDHRVHKCEQK